MRKVRKLLAGIAGVYDPWSYAERETRPTDDRLWYSANPDELYPATVARIVQVLSEPGLPHELIDPNSIMPTGVAAGYMDEARLVPPSGWTLALLPKDADADQPGRAAALDLARRWFTQALHVKAGGVPMGLHITNNPDYRL